MKPTAHKPLDPWHHLNLSANTFPITKSFDNFKWGLGLTSTIIGAAAGGGVGELIGIVITSETGGWGVIPGAIIGGVIGGALGYAGYFEGYYGWDWAAAQVGAHKAFEACIDKAGECNKKHIDAVWDVIWNGGN